MAAKACKRVALKNSGVYRVGMTRPLRAIVGSLFALLYVSRVTAADAPWLGVPMPETARQAREQRVKEKFVELNTPQLEVSALTVKSAYPDIRAQDLIQSVRDIVAFAEKSRVDGNTLWGRISGSPYELMTAKYLEAKFKEYGLSDAHIESFPRPPQPWPASWKVTLLADAAYGADTHDYNFDLAFPAEKSVSSPAAGLEADLIYVGLGRAADLAGREVNGKIAVVHALLQPSAFANSAVGAAERLAKLGAAAVITVMDVPAPVQFVPYGVGSDRIPCFTLNGDDGKFLEEVIGRAAPVKPARMKLALKMEEKAGWNAQNVLATIPGSSDEVLMLTAHMDSFFYGANDNASGLANLLALARHYSRPGAPKPRRSLVFVATSGHHVHDDKGSYSVGVNNLLASHGDLLKHTVFVYNAEHIGARHTEVQRDLVSGGSVLITTNQVNPFLVSVSNRSPKVIQLLNDSIGRYGIPALTQTNHFPIGDPAPFFFAGIPVVNLISSGTWYHSTADTPETLSPAALERFARASTDFLDQVDAVSAEELEKDAKSQWVMRWFGKWIQKSVLKK